MTDQQLEEELEVLVAEDDKDDFEVLTDVIKNLPLKVILSRAENGDGRARARRRQQRLRRACTGQARQP